MPIREIRGKILEYQMILLRITYRLRAHHMQQFERVFADQILPIAREYPFRFQGIWRTVVGEVGEYMEIWEFDSMAAFEADWNRLLLDPRILAIFEITGPMVEGERFAILQNALN